MNEFGQLHTVITVNNKYTCRIEASKITQQKNASRLIATITPQYQFKYRLITSADTSFELATK